MELKISCLWHCLSIHLSTYISSTKLRKQNRTFSKLREVSNSDKLEVTNCRIVLLLPIWSDLLCPSRGLISSISLTLSDKSAKSFEQILVCGLSSLARFKLFSSLLYCPGKNRVQFSTVGAIDFLD